MCDLRLIHRPMGSLGMVWAMRISRDRMPIGNDDGGVLMFWIL